VRHALFRIRDALDTLLWTVTGWLPGVRACRELEVRVDELALAVGQLTGRSAEMLLAALLATPPERPELRAVSKEKS
jgi:hypothetical protein